VWSVRGFPTHVVYYAKLEEEIAAASNDKITGAFAAYGHPV
jgi:hypothetical protein